MSETEKKKNDSQSQVVGENKGLAPAFAIRRIYVKDLSLETPNSPFIFETPWEPKVDVQLNVNSRKVADGLYEVVISVTVTTKVGEKVAFLIEVQQAGVFAIANFPDAQVHRMLGSYCPNILFPFARELVSDLVGRAGFPPLYLTPINFDALYEQQMVQQGQGGELPN